MKKINNEDFIKVQRLFETMDHSRAVVFSVLEGNSPGDIYVDDIACPKAALLYVKEAFFYVVGEEECGSFYTEIPKVLFDELIPKLEEKEMILFTGSDSLREKMNSILSQYEIITIQRKFFKFNADQFSKYSLWKEKIPEGFRILPIDTEAVEKEPSFARVLETGSERFGVYLAHGDKIAGYCTSVFVGHGEAEIDIFTDDNYRGRGLARLTACAFIDECLSRGLIPSWACWPEREASRKMALQLGFEELPDVPALLWFEETNVE